MLLESHLRYQPCQYRTRWEQCPSPAQHLSQVSSPMPPSSEPLRENHGLLPSCVSKAQSQASLGGNVPPTLREAMQGSGLTAGARAAKPSYPGPCTPTLFLPQGGAALGDLSSWGCGAKPVPRRGQASREWDGEPSRSRVHLLRSPPQSPGPGERALMASPGSGWT